MIPFSRCSVFSIWNLFSRIILSLFAILFAYDAVNGEKERGTLRLHLCQRHPERQLILGKIIWRISGARSAIDAGNI
ncbi:MAG: ABC transporter permease subunit [Calditrichia bacterium]